jgi:hypothetical protein
VRFANLLRSDPTLAGACSHQDRLLALGKSSQAAFQVAVGKRFQIVIGRGPDRLLDV